MALFFFFGSFGGTFSRYTVLIMIQRHHSGVMPQLPLQITEIYQEQHLFENGVFHEDTHQSSVKSWRRDEFDGGGLFLILYAGKALWTV